MEAINKDLILNEIPLFAGLTNEQRRIIKGKCSLKEYKKGEIIYREGSCADAFYCLVLGRVMIYARDKNAEEAPLEYLHRGKYFGIISLLTGEPHSVTAKAINDCVLLIIEKDDFDYVLNKAPRLAIDLAHTLSRRLKRKDIHQKTIFESTVISVFSSYSQSGKTIYAMNLGLSLFKETQKKIVILDILPREKTHSLPQRLDITQDRRIFDLSSTIINTSGLKDFILKTRFDLDLICLSYSPQDESCVRKLVEILSLLVSDYHYLILDLPSLMDRQVFAILNQSDLIYILTSPDSVDLKRTHNLTEKLKEDFHFQESKIKVVINEYKFSKLSHEEQIGILAQNIAATLPKIEFNLSDRLILEAPDCEYSKVVRRISRQLGDCQIGLVLGVGVAYGFCHIGVLKVIEEEKIPIDVICGSSIGAVIASLWAIGKSADEILEITQEFRKPKFMWGMVDLTFPLIGFIKGNKLYNVLKNYLGNKTFYDLRLPLKIIASDVKRKEPRVLDKGLIVDAIMASCTMPGVFTPFKFKGEVLFDGGITNPLPTEPLFKMGVKKIIAVNVTPSRQDIMRQYELLKEKITVTIPDSIKKKKWFNLRQYLKGILKNNILDIIFSSVEILQSEVAQKEAQLADVVLHPDTFGLYWLDLHKAAEFAKRGEEEARANLDKIKQLVND
jgi:NTE family protein